MDGLTAPGGFASPAVRDPRSAETIGRLGAPYMNWMSSMYWNAAGLISAISQ